jgi:hypothetical protein
MQGWTMFGSAMWNVGWHAKSLRVKLIFVLVDQDNFKSEVSNWSLF